MTCVFWVLASCRHAQLVKLLILTGLLPTLFMSLEPLRLEFEKSGFVLYKMVVYKCLYKHAHARVKGFFQDRLPPLSTHGTSEGLLIPTVCRPWDIPGTDQFPRRWCHVRNCWSIISDGCWVVRGSEQPPSYSTDPHFLFSHATHANVVISLQSYSTSPRLLSLFTPENFEQIRI